MIYTRFCSSFSIRKNSRTIASCYILYVAGW
nr:MAG TPA: hypothetical protein [Caudoviricetes sp.]